MSRRWRITERLRQWRVFVPIEGETEEEVIKIWMKAKKEGLCFTEVEEEPSDRKLTIERVDDEGIA